MLSGPQRVSRLGHAALVGAAGSATATYVATGSMKDAFISAGTALAFAGVGQALQDAGRIERAFAHGLIGGAAAAASGGDFASGFAAASFTKLVSMEIQEISINDGAGLLMAAVTSGIASEITGGQFGPAAIRGAMGYALNQAFQERQDSNEIAPDQFELGLDFEISPTSVLRMRGGRLGRALEILGANLALSADGEISLGLSGEAGFGAELAYDGRGSFRLSSPLGTVDLERTDFDFLLGPNPPFGPGWEAGFTAQLDPKFALRGNLIVGSVGLNITIRLTPQQRSMLSDPIWWMQNLTGRAPIGLGPNPN